MNDEGQGTLDEAVFKRAKDLMGEATVKGRRTYVLLVRNGETGAFPLDRGVPSVSPEVDPCNLLHFPFPALLLKFDSLDSTMPGVDHRYHVTDVPSLKVSPQGPDPEEGSYAYPGPCPVLCGTGPAMTRLLYELERSRDCEGDMGYSGDAVNGCRIHRSAELLTQALSFGPDSVERLAGPLRNASVTVESFLGGWDWGLGVGEEESDLNPGYGYLGASALGDTLLGAQILAAVKVSEAAQLLFPFSMQNAEDLDPLLVMLVVSSERGKVSPLSAKSFPSGSFHLCGLMLDGQGRSPPLYVTKGGMTGAEFQCWRGLEGLEGKLEFKVCLFPQVRRSTVDHWEELTHLAQQTLASQRGAMRGSLLSDEGRLKLGLKAPSAVVEGTLHRLGEEYVVRYQDAFNNSSEEDVPRHWNQWKAWEAARRGWRLEGKGGYLEKLSKGGAPFFLNNPDEEEVPKSEEPEGESEEEPEEPEGSEEGPEEPEGSEEEPEGPGGSPVW